MPDFGIFRGFNDKLFGNKLYAGQLPTQLGKALTWHKHSTLPRNVLNIIPGP